jgi:hypothetical protein
MSKSYLDKFEAGNWVFVSPKPVADSEVKRYLSVDKYKTYFRLCSGRVLRILALDKQAKMVNIRVTNTHSIWLRVEWVVPLSDSEAERVRYENECLAESNRQIAVANRKRDKMMEEVFQSAGARKAVQKKKEEEKKKGQSANRITAPFKFDYLDGEWFED